MDIYLDIDGVLLANETHLANHAENFLTYVLSTYPDSTYWLTTHCNGDASVPIQRFGHLFKTETVILMQKIKPTRWQTSKTEGIDFSKPFLWYDDDLYPEEREELIKHDVLASWVQIDLHSNQDQLLDVLSRLKQLNGL